MRSIKIFLAIITAAFQLSLVACSKGENDLLLKSDMVPVTVNGYNGGTEALVIKVDTFKFVTEPPAGLFNLTDGFTFPEGKNSVRLTVTEKHTGKILVDSMLKKENGAATIKFFYYDGKVSDMPELPAVEEGKIKITYMFEPRYTNYTEPVDIALGKFYFTPKVFEEIIRIRNVKPNEFTQPVTLSTFPTTGQTYNGQPTAVLFLVYIYKAGTNEFYTTGTPYAWNVSSSTAPKPAAATASSKLYIFSENVSSNTMRFDKKLEL